LSTDGGGFYKNVAKSSAVRVGEGGGGLRRENFLKARESPKNKLKSLKKVHFFVVVCHFSSRDISRE